MCCLQGQVNLPSIQWWPHALQDLFDDLHDHTQFKNKIRQYNNTLTFTSVGIDINDQVAGLASFHIHGALHYLMGALIPSNDDIQPSYVSMIYSRQLMHMLNTIPSSILEFY